MTRTFKNVAIFGKPRADGMRDSLALIARIVQRCGQTVMFDAATRKNAGLRDYKGYSVAQIRKTADVAIVLGGDGTMLGVARELSPSDIALIGINHGRLGFITDIAIDQMSDVLPAMLRGQFESERRVQLDADVLRDGESIFRGRAWNDVVVARGVAGGMVEFTVRVDGLTMYNQRADGIIVSTPTGSTAYSLSANGPILHPSLAGFVLVPIAPQTLSNRPIAVPDSFVIEIEITDVRDASAHFDMQAFAALRPGDVVRARKSKDAVTLLHPTDYNYFATLRSKLSWNFMPSEPHTRF